MTDAADDVGTPNGDVTGTQMTSCGVKWRPFIRHRTQRSCSPRLFTASYRTTAARPTGGQTPASARRPAGTDHHRQSTPPLDHCGPGDPLITAQRLCPLSDLPAPPNTAPLCLCLTVSTGTLRLGVHYVFCQRAQASRQLHTPEPSLTDRPSARRLDWTE